MSDLDLDAIRTHIERAHDEVSELCLGTHRWTMRIPAQPGRDSDLVIADALADAERLLAEVERLRRDNERLSDTSLWDGGAWDVEYEAPDGSDGPYWSDVRWFDSTRQRRRWTGPATPIEPADDLAVGDE